MRIRHPLEAWVLLPLHCPTTPHFFHLPSLIDYIAVSGTMERNVLEFVDHLHEHFHYPCSINSKGRYNVPSNPAEGYRYDFCLSLVCHCQSKARTHPLSIEIREQSIAEYEWPNGSYWAKGTRSTLEDIVGHSKDSI